MRIGRGLDRLEEYLTAALLAAMTGLTFVQVVLRYVFDSGLIWALEATTYLFGWLVLIGISVGIRTNSHIAVDLVSDRLPRSVHKAIAIVGVVLCFGYAVLMAYGSFMLVARLRDFGSLAHDIPLPRWILLASLPIGFTLLGLRIAQTAVAVVRGTSPGLGAAEYVAPGQIESRDERS